jgi:hypothetical protein
MQDNESLFAGKFFSHPNLSLLNADTISANCMERDNM